MALRPFRPLASFTGAGIIMLTAACGSSSDGGSGGSSAKGAGGSPIKIGVIADVGTAVDFGDGVSGARAAVAGVNKRGGIDGRKLQLVFCNGGLNPNKDAACVRSMISNKVMAMVGTEYVSYEEAGDKQFERAGIANVAPTAYGYGTSDPNSYLLSPGQQFLNAGQAVAAVKYGGKRVGLLRVDIPTTVPFVTALQKALPKVGGVYAGQVAVPQTSTDFAPAAANLVAKKPDVITTDANETQDTQVLKEMSALGYRGKEVVAQDALSYKTLLSLGSLANRVIFTSSFPPVSAADTIPELAQFKTDMAAQVATGDNEAASYATYNRDVVMGSYFGVVAVAKIASAANATDAGSFKKAIDAAKDVQLGVIPPWTPNSSVSKAVTRASNGSMYFSRWNNGKVELLEEKPTDVAAVVDASN